MRKMIQNPEFAHAVHYLFESLALILGVMVYRHQGRQKTQAGLLSATTFPVVLGCLIGAAIGNKLVFWLQYPHLWVLYKNDFLAWFMGQSIVGGLLGGWLGVELGKKWAGIQKRTGDNFVLPILLGIVVGRIGCFLAGLHDATYGLPSSLPWAIDFGDGIARHPTQLYEAGLALFLLLTYRYWHHWFSATPGLSFRVLMWVYLLWRLAVDFLKPVPYAYPLGLSGIQWVCALALLLISTLLITEKMQKTS